MFKTFSYSQITQSKIAVLRLELILMIKGRFCCDKTLLFYHCCGTAL